MFEISFNERREQDDRDLIVRQIERAQRSTISVEMMILSGILAGKKCRYGGSLRRYGLSKPDVAPEVNMIHGHPCAELLVLAAML